jgi:hypothetical protein
LTGLEEGTLPPRWDGVGIGCRVYQDAVFPLESAQRDKVAIQEHVK